MGEVVPESSAPIHTSDEDLTHDELQRNNADAGGDKVWKRSIQFGSSFVVDQDPFFGEEAEEGLGTKDADKKHEKDERDAVLDVLLAVTEVPVACGEDDAEEEEDDSLADHHFTASCKTREGTASEDEGLGWKREWSPG